MLRNRDVEINVELCEAVEFFQLCELFGSPVFVRRPRQGRNVFVQPQSLRPGSCSFFDRLFVVAVPRDVPFSATVETGDSFVLLPLFFLTVLCRKLFSIVLTDDYRLSGAIATTVSCTVAASTFWT